MPTIPRYPDYHQMAEAQARLDYANDQRRYPAHHDDAEHTDYSPLPLDKMYFPRPGAPVRYAVYGGSLEGYASVTDDWTLLFRSPGSLWYPTDQHDLVILGLVGEAEAQLALDRCAGGYSKVCTSRRQTEV